MEECLSLAQPGGILSRLQRDWPAGDDVAGGSEIRHVLPLLLNRSTQRADYAVRTAASLSFAVSNRMAGAQRNPAKSREGVLTLNQFLGYDLNTVEFAIRDGVPVAIDFCNPAPDAEAANVGQANFEWVVEAVSEMAIRKAREHVPGRDNLSWGKFLQAAVTKRSLRRSRVRASTIAASAGKGVGDIESHRESSPSTSAG